MTDSTVGRPEPDAEVDLSAVATSSKAVISAFEQAGAILAATKGSDMRLVAWNRMARQALVGAPGLGSAWRGSAWMVGTGLEDALVTVYERGETVGATEWPLTLPDAAGEPRDVIYDLGLVPWRRPDGSVQGVLAVGIEVAEQVRRRRVLETAAERWREGSRSSRDAATALQAAMLPTSVPVLPGVQVGARYLLTEADSATGGDWFSALVLPDGRLAMVVGDVVGHGVPASATMGQLRAVLEHRLRSGDDLVSALDALDAFAAAVPAAQAASICLAVVDPTSGVVEYCTAGHPPPLLVTGDRWRYLETTGAGVLGSGRGFAVASSEIASDGLLLLYSDGLVERPGVTWSESTVEIGQAVTAALSQPPAATDASAHAPDRVCEQVLRQLTSEAGIDDDVTVLAVRRIAVPTSLDRQWEVFSLDELVSAADDLDRWLVGVDASCGNRQDLLHALVELATNSVEHGSDPDAGRPPQVRVRAELDPAGEAVIVVADTGQWREPEQPPSVQADDGVRSRGLGLPLVDHLVDDMSVEHGPEGTTVEIRLRLSRPAPILASPVPSRTPPTPSVGHELAAYVATDRPHTLVVHGPVTATTADELSRAIQVESRGVTHPLSVNLDGVTHLASAGVHVLQQVRRQADSRGVRLTLSAAAGTVTDHVLRLVGMPPDPPSPTGSEAASSYGTPPKRSHP